MDYQGMFVYMVIGAASAFIARRLYEWYKSRRKDSSCGEGCGCGGPDKH